MDSDQGKLFIGGISWETSEDELKEYFGNYGEVVQTVVMRDKATGRPRGFGFVVFSDPSILDRVLQDNHVIDGRTVRRHFLIQFFLFFLLSIFFFVSVDVIIVELGFCFNFFAIFLSNIMVCFFKI